MLHNTFLHIPGIGEKMEQRIWQAGFLSRASWKPPFPPTLPPKIVSLVTRQLPYLAEGDDGSAAFHAGQLPRRQLWRLFPHFRGRIAYLDIETNGNGGEACEITTIALFDGTRLRTYVQGCNLDDFSTDIAGYDIIVTYNGLSFDVPIIESFLHTRLRQIHIDLRFALASLGYKGGLKGCERQLGIERMELDGLDGLAAVFLWRKFMESGDKGALATLLAYNCADAANLERLLVHAYNLNIADTPFRLSHYIPLPEPPAILHQPDRRIVQWLRGNAGAACQLRR